jgi:hypothetical protein
MSDPNLHIKFAFNSRRFKQDLNKRVALEPERPMVDLARELFADQARYVEVDVSGYGVLDDELLLAKQ